MDELLELMNNDCIDDSTSIVDRDGDDDSSTEVNAQHLKNAVSSAENRIKRDGVHQARQKASRTSVPDRSNPTTQSSQHLAKASIDDRLDIRMTNRLVSSNDLVELVTDYEYHSPSVLSAMTLKRLNALLQDPSPIIDPATVAGKTEGLVTIGIVFSNTGTRISSKGGAFCVLTIGNLNSGPCLTIFLFGEAYGKYCTNCKPGKVIVLMAPKLLPASRGDAGGKNRGHDADRTVSFSVYDAGQLKIVANARDYGTCKHPGCKNYVDRRNSEYCEFHRRQQKAKGGKQSVNRFQQLKSTHNQASAILVDSTARKRNLLGFNSSKKSNRLLDKTSVTNTSSVQAAKPTKTASAGGSTSTNRYLSVNVPKNMSKVPERKSNKIHTIPSGFRPSKKPLAKREAAVVSDHGTSTNGSKRPKNSVNGDWLEQGKAMSKERGHANISGRKGFSLAYFTEKQRSVKSNSNTATTTTTNRNKSRFLNTDGKGFDGSVLVPKPNSVLFRPSSTPNEDIRRIETPKDDTKAREEVLQRQADLARQMKGGRPQKCEEKKVNSILSKRRISASRSKQSTKGPLTKKSTEVNDFLSAMGGAIDEEKIRNAKSKFASEVEADEYAKQRRRVDELEKAEASHESRNKGKNAEKKRITRTWFCKDCGKNYYKIPVACSKADHRVNCRTHIKEDTTKDERKNELNKKNEEDGGLRLGTGINWNPYGNR